MTDTPPPGYQPAPAPYGFPQPPPHPEANSAMVLGIVQSLLQLPLGTTWAQTVFYLALFATLLVRPQGFFGGRLAQRF